METKPLGIIARMGALWTRFDFVSEVVMKDKSPTPAWKFWFFWGTIFSLLITVIFMFHIEAALVHFEETGVGPLVEVQTQMGEQFELMMTLWRDNHETFLWSMGFSSFLLVWFFLVVFRILLVSIMAGVFWIWGKKLLGKKKFLYGHAFTSTLHIGIVPLIFATVFLVNGWFMPELYFLIGVFIMGMNLRNLKN